MLPIALPCSSHTPLPACIRARAQAAGLTLADGYFRDSVAYAVRACTTSVCSHCERPPPLSCDQVCAVRLCCSMRDARRPDTAVASPGLQAPDRVPSCWAAGIPQLGFAHVQLPWLWSGHSTQVRAALSEAAQLAPRLGYGSSQDVMANARAAQDPNWLSCVFGLTVAPPPGYELPPIPAGCNP